MNNPLIVLTVAILFSTTAVPNAQAKSSAHEAAPTLRVGVKGTKFGYRSFGEQCGILLFFSRHFTGTMENWDRVETNALAKIYLILV